MTAGTEVLAGRVGASVSWTGFTKRALRREGEPRLGRSLAHPLDARPFLKPI